MRCSDFCEMLSFYSENKNAALIYEKDGKKAQMSYKELLKAILCRSDELKKSGKTAVAVFCSPTVECITEIFAAAKAKMQITLLDEGLSDEIIEKQIKLSDSDMIFSADKETAESFKEYLTDGTENNSGRILFFTSGTTSMSKAVVLSEKSLCSSAYNGSCMLPLTNEDTLLCLLPLSHVFGFVCSLLWGLSCGASVALSRGPRYITEDFDFYKPTVVSIVPMLLGFFIKNRLFNSELKTILVGAGDCPEVLLNAAKAAGYRISFGYGLTETSSGVAISVSGDPHAMEICPDNIIKIAPDGEILINAPTCIMQGYYKDEKSTGEAIKDGFLYSGDLGYLDEQGKLHITGRKKEMLVLPSGNKIFLPDYEKTISDALNNNELAVILLNSKPVLVINETVKSREEILTELSEIMKEIPRSQQIADIIVTDKPMPRTATGKIKRWEIQKTEEEKNDNNDKR